MSRFGHYSVEVIVALGQEPAKHASGYRQYTEQLSIVIDLTATDAPIRQTYEVTVFASQGIRHASTTQDDWPHH